MAKKKVKKAVKKTKKVVRKKPAVKKAVSKRDIIEEKVMKHSVGKKRISSSTAVIALILNLILPGVGTLIGGKTKEGVWQLILALGSGILGVILILTVVGAPFGVLLIILGPLVAWIWALISGIKLVQESG